MVTVYMVCGPSGCGKTTFAKRFTKKHSNMLYVSTDEIRQELWGDEADQQQGDVVFRTAYSRIFNGIESGYDVIFDAINISKKRRIDFINRCRRAGATFCVCYAFTGQIDRCLSNQQRRKRVVPKHIVRRQCNNYEMPTEEEGWTAINLMEAYNG